MFVRGMLAIALFFTGIYVWAQATIGVAVEETRTKIAVIDTGFDYDKSFSKYLCRTGHVSFVDGNPFIDGHKSKHGTNVAGLIAESIDPAKHCILVIKFYSDYLNANEFNNYVRYGIDYAVAQNAKYINLSLGGAWSSQLEFLSLEEALMKGVKVAAAAGNDGKNLDVKCYYYPACYKFKAQSQNFHVVGSTTGTYGNKGKIVKFKEDGSFKGTPRLSGTSQATAIHMGKWVQSDAK